MVRITLVGLVLLLAACPKKSTTPTAGGSAAPPTAQNRGVADTMADAPTQTVPGSRQVRPPCNQSGYLRLAVAPGVDFTVEVKMDKGCASAGVLNASGSPVGEPVDACARTPKNLVGKGQDTTTFLAISETGACEANTVTLTIK